MINKQTCGLWLIENLGCKQFMFLVCTDAKKKVLEISLLNRRTYEITSASKDDHSVLESWMLADRKSMELKSTPALKITNVTKQATIIDIHISGD